eukprot:TCALIF_13399-PA protein Name:"Protein of unknown function" AED:0.53 eAED:0.53 QI:0/0/0/0.4/1/1/5/0/152
MSSALFTRLNVQPGFSDKMSHRFITIGTNSQAKNSPLATLSIVFSRPKEGLGATALIQDQLVQASGPVWLIDNGVLRRERGNCKICYTAIDVIDVSVNGLEEVGLIFMPSANHSTFASGVIVLRQKQNWGFWGFGWCILKIRTDVDGGKEED